MSSFLKKMNVDLKDVVNYSLDLNGIHNMNSYIGKEIKSAV